jgi:hypothetical protein
VHEVLFAAPRNIEHEFERTFVGMTMEPVELPALLIARERMMHELQVSLVAEERDFLISLVKNQPDWSLLGIAHLDRLPGINWKLRNLSQLQKSNPKKFATQADALEKLLG